MQILYGVNGTGNGHITRARIMGKHLKEAGAEITFLFSGRPQDQYFDMDFFHENFECIYKTGLTFVVERGKVNYFKTALHNNIYKLLKDINNLDVSDYDVVITDFEPISAWAAKNQEVECIGIGHQYAFEYDIPKLDNDFFTDMFMKWYAPAEIGVGLHWHHFDYPILPPIIETPVEYEIVPRKIIVYLPFEEPSDVIRVLSQFTDNEFHVYGSGVDRDVPKHIHLHSLSRVNFLNDFASSCGVICGAGFELVSEALMLHKQILVKPLHGQMEQLSNATALSLLDYGDVLWNINERTGDDILSPVEIIGEWLDYVDNMTGYQLHKKANFFPNTAHYLTKWVLAGSRCDVDELSDLVWSDIDRTK